MWFCCRGQPPKNEEEAVKPLDRSSSHHTLAKQDFSEAIVQSPLDDGARKLAEDMDSQSAKAFFSTLVDDMASGVASGAINVRSSHGSFQNISPSGTHSVDGKFPEFLSSLHTVPGAKVKRPAHSRMVSQDSEFAFDTTFISEGKPAVGIPYLDYRRYLIKPFIKLPIILQPFLRLPFFDHYLVIGCPTGSPSAGLEGYREVVPKAVRAAAPFLVVIDKPGKLQEWKGDRYIWVEFPLGDVFMLDIRSMMSMDDYFSSLTRKGKQNYRDKTKKFKSGPISWEMVKLELGQRSFVDVLWPLYKQTGEKNGFTVLSKEEFYEFHLTVPNLSVMMVYDVQDPAHRKLVSCCTSARWRDVLMPLWCGTDYSNDLHRTCSTYFNIHYNYVGLAIADPEVNWLDLGASRRSVKMSMGFKPYPASGYFRCKNAVMQALVETMIARYFKPNLGMNDP